MKISELSFSKVIFALKNEGLQFKVGPFLVNAKSEIPEVAENISRLYGAYEVSGSPFADFHIGITPSKGVHRFWHKQANFVFDGFVPFKPLPYEQSFALFEWGLNWCIASYMHQYFILHSAVVEKNDIVVLLPGSPGAGKSTLCTSLVNSGWRLFSDEMALVNPENLDVVPVPRPISLKNESIEVIANKFPDVEFGLIAEDTHKGRITHVKPSAKSIERANEYSKADWIIYPKYTPNVRLQVEEIHKAESFMKAAEQGFNYNVLGGEGFETLVKIIDATNSYSLEYSNIDEAIAFFNELPEIKN